MDKPETGANMSADTETSNGTEASNGTPNGTAKADDYGESADSADSADIFATSSRSVGDPLSYDLAPGEAAFLSELKERREAAGAEEAGATHLLDCSCTGCTSPAPKTARGWQGKL